MTVTQPWVSTHCCVSWAHLKAATSPQGSIISNSLKFWCKSKHSSSASRKALTGQLRNTLGMGGCNSVRYTGIWFSGTICDMLHTSSTLHSRFKRWHKAKQRGASLKGNSCSYFWLNKHRGIIKAFFLFWNTEQAGAQIFTCWGQQPDRPVTAVVAEDREKQLSLLGAWLYPWDKCSWSYLK